MSASDEFRLPKLSSDNYHTWSIRTRAALVQKGCWEAIDPGFSVGAVKEREKAIDNKAPTFLFLVVEDNYLDDIGTCTTARDAWNTLQDMHTNFGLLHILQLMRDFFNVKMKRDESMQDYLGRLIDLHGKLSSAGYAFTDREVALVMLIGLPETYEQLILNLEQDEETLTTRTVKTRLLIEEKRRLQSSEECTSDEESRTMALISKARSKIESKQHNEKVHPPNVKKDEKKNQVHQKNKETLACLENDVAHINRPVVVVGDFNGHIEALDGTTDRAGRLLLEWTERLGLTLVNSTEKVYGKDNMGASIDSTGERSLVSDHHGIFLCFGTNSVETKRDAHASSRRPLSDEALENVVDQLEEDAPRMGGTNGRPGGTEMLRRLWLTANNAADDTGMLWGVEQMKPNVLRCGRYT
ncbi:hypothetical protein HPB52_022699 [Rhipicephalus sanguineus]|uniref:DUF4219 domain-containing protein n=1 Tax=Rhipicephalus sanguineus TaxID=34632 RepID=A0A9D4STX9_RHISA|nr:hypothetical protein HPB52_022699 [Rhipicephalus sanguineus]